LKDGDKLKPRVQVVNGQSTSILRKQWGLNSILSRGDIDTKNRGDHRHHAIDAIVIACTTPSMSMKLALESKFDDLGNFANKPVKEPWKSFLEDSREAINSIIVSFRNQKRLIGKKPNKSKAKNLEKYPDGFVKQQTVTIRGPLHEETIYGSIELDGKDTFVTRWPLEKFAELKQLEKVVDPKVRETLLKRVKKYKGDIKKAFAENPDDPVIMYSTKGASVRIKKVRVMNPSDKLIEVRPNAFVESGNNYAIAIYGDYETKNREFETIQFIEATRRALKKEPIIPSMKNGKPLLFTLQQRDTVVRYDVHPDEIEWDNMDYLRTRLFRVRKIDTVGQIFIDCLFVADVKKEDRNRLFFQLRPNTMRCVKVKIDILGNLVRKVAAA
jgi:CRISPR-associated endonuclease Csn1